MVDRIAGFLAPTPHEPGVEDWVPPALSAAATTPPQPTTPKKARSTPQSQDWQERAWAFYRAKGPARQAVDWLANGISRMHLYIGQIKTDGVGDPEPVPDPGLAGEILAELHEGRLGQRDMLHRLAVHLLVPGESWLIGYPRPPQPGEKKDQTTDRGTAWQVCSRKEWELGSVGDDTVTVKIPRHPKADDDGWVEFPSADVVVVPIYQPDPQDATRSTSRFESAMDDLAELDGLSRRTAADIKSRLAGAGLLLLPESATVPNPGMSEGGGVAPIHGDPLVAALTAAASTAIQDPDSPSATVPITATIADEAIAKMQHLNFFSEFDSQVPTLRDGARNAVAVALDVPATVVQGIEDLNHWSAWSVQEDAIRTHLGPLVSLICVTLTREVLWPALRAAGQGDVENIVIWWDASEIELRPDRSHTAIEAFKHRIIGGEATRRELGFDEDDAPAPGEMPPQFADPPGGGVGQSGPPDAQESDQRVRQQMNSA
ncbi:hypothetical protein FB384_004914 [Prauserella sediminis]|uniref:SPP1 Gp6-like portal protein n=1 Tax=Prauserella sediminis TaxID=577680 RepID=A0A839Y224_9PSEU|nr:hypothetical protein [Prauserella sediminis]MBB3665955.1 hypothetical protein [Prauserella sediminis]